MAVALAGSSWSRALFVAPAVPRSSLGGMALRGSSGRWQQAHGRRRDSCGRAACRAERARARLVKPKSKGAGVPASEARDAPSTCAVKAAACDIDETTAQQRRGGPRPGKAQQPRPRVVGSSRKSRMVDNKKTLDTSGATLEPARISKRSRLPMAKMVEKVVRSDAVLLVDILGTLMLSVCYGLDTLSLSEFERDAISAVEIDTTLYFAGLLVARWYATDMSWKTVFSPLGLVDLVSVAPLLSSVRSTGSFLRVLRILKIARLLQRDELSRLVSLAAGKKIDVQDYQLKITQAGFTLFSVIWVTAGVVYEAESGAGVDTFSNFFDALYYSITTLTSVGFGDIVPQSAAGKAVTTGAVLLYSVLIPYELAILAQSMGFMNDKDSRVRAGPAQRTAVCENCQAENHQIDAVYCRRCGEKLPVA